jgi:SAM-dependent methyltransferase
LVENFGMNSLEQFEAEHVKPRQGRTLIIGSHVYPPKPDRRKLYQEVVGVDMLEGEGVDRVINMEESLPEDLGLFDHIECMSVMEHSRRPWLMAQNIERLLKPKGTLFLAAPFVWKIHAYPDDYFRFTPNGLRSLFTKIKWKTVMFASNELRSEKRVVLIHKNEYPYLPRSEVVAFGKRA